jgi:small ligand-binding sensory domain FIST
VAGQGAAAGVFDGGLSGVAFGSGVTVLSRITQGCQPIGTTHTITSAVDNVVLTLDDEPALDVLLDTLGVSLQDDTENAIEQVTATLAGLVEAETPLPKHRIPGHFGVETLVRPIVWVLPWGKK